MDVQAVSGAAEKAEVFRDLFRDIFDFSTLERVVWVLLTLGIGFLIVRLALSLSRRVAAKRLSPRGIDIVDKIVRYGGMTLVLVNAAKIAGFDLSAILGAAGVAGIAIGFAAQTSVSNVISGLFLFSEKSFVLGDVVQLDTVTGVVESVDMLSVKIRTFDNRLVRVPNETMIKSNIVNITRWPTRRLDISLTLPYGSDPKRAEAIFRESAATSPAALKDPAPVFVVDQLGPNGLGVFFGVWFKKDDYLALKNSFLPELLARLEAAGMRPAAQVLNLATMPREYPEKASTGDPKAPGPAPGHKGRGTSRAKTKES